MHFKLELILTHSFDKEFEISPDDAGLPALIIRFSRVTDEKDKAYGRCLCTVLTQLTPPQKIAELLQNVPKPTPNNLKNFVNDLEVRLGDAATRAVRLLVWFCGSAAGHNPIGASKRLAFSTNGIEWRGLPRTVSLHLTVGFDELIVTDAVAASVVELWQEGTDEPLAHELFREAAAQEEDNPRSCLVLGVAAAEVGFKQLVGNLVPDAKWLADNVPSPPLVKMLKHYLPVLPTKARVNGTTPKVPSQLIKALDEAVRLRNEVAHTESNEIPRDALHQMLKVIYDCVYLFDFCNGHRWAWDRISNETQTLIAQESSMKGQGSSKLKK